jgi:hypothetical protein
MSNDYVVHVAVYRNGPQIHAQGEVICRSE